MIRIQQSNNLQSDNLIINFNNFYNMGQSCTNSTYSGSQVQQFRTRNSYLGQIPANKQPIRRILQQLVYGHPISQEHTMLATFISKQHNQQFIDPYFKFLQSFQGSTSCSLRKMYDFQKRNIYKVYNSRKSPLNIFDQKQLQFTYLTCVFYLFCVRPELKQKVFLTRNINPYTAYILQLFCNGKPTTVVLDQLIPTQVKDIKYLSGRYIQQIWPFLLQKAWCKQIGFYDRARGLSPEDCFQQITGIPAFSYSFSRFSPVENLDNIRSAQKKGYWIVFVAKLNQSNPDVGLKNRQVLYLQNMQEAKGLFHLRTPYLGFRLYSNTNNSYNYSEGSLSFNYQQLLNYFEYYTVGMYTQEFFPQSFPIKCQKNKQFIYEVNILKKGEVSIRFSQFYKSYLNIQQDLLYDYSPVILQLYDSQCNIIKYCQGRAENLIGIRSSYLSEMCFVNLAAGKYYLRILVSWDNEASVNQGNIVVYAAKNTVQIHKCVDQSLDFLSKLLTLTLQNSRKVIDNDLQQLRVRFVQKAHGYVLGIENMSRSPSNLKVILKGSKNIRINHRQLVDNTFQLQLEGQSQRVLEILPNNPRQEYHLTSFDVIKID